MRWLERSATRHEFLRVRTSRTRIIRLHGRELATLLHSDDEPEHAHGRSRELVRDLLAESAKAGDVRDDASADELASYCLNALSAAGGVRSKAAVERLVTVTLFGIRPQP